MRARILNYIFILLQHLVYVNFFYLYLGFLTFFILISLRLIFLTSFLSEDAKKIKAPTILIYGNYDSEVPREDTLEYERLIKDCGLILYEGCTHFAYLERLNQTISIIDNFIR